MSELLKIENLAVAFGHSGERTRVVNGVSFTINAGEKVALVGESGSGKSVTALSVLQLHDRSQTDYPSGRILFEEEEILHKSERAMRGVRGRDVAMIFQEPMTALNPVYTIGEQLIEPLMLHEGLNREDARERMIALLDRVGIKEPEKRFSSFPHQLSGGQRQRAMIAMALACRPKLLIADEPTTALDVTIQNQILELLNELQREFNMAVLLITHDLNMVRHFAESICVMEQGKLVEQGSIATVFENPQHPYTRKLLASDPVRLVEDDASNLMKQSPVVSGNAINVCFPIKAGFFKRQVGEVRAVDQVNLTIHPGETLGIVGESGSGKTTLGMSLLRLQTSEGEILFDGHDISAMREHELRPLRRKFQVVFQDPFSSLSPRMTIEQIIGEGLKLHFPELTAAQRRRRIETVMEEVGLDNEMLQRYPHEFSGGQRQRIAIARVVVLEPKLIMLDEPTSALDVSVQKQVLGLLRELQVRHNISYLFISHDLRVIRSVSHRVLVMRNGKIVEQGATEELFSSPQHEYTQLLLNAALYRDVS